MRLLGLLGGMSWQSTAIYYRLLNEGARNYLGGQHSAQLVLWSFDFHEMTGLKAEGNWPGIAVKAVDAAQRLETLGAGAIVVCSNTMHRVAPEIKAAVSIPLIDIVDATAKAIEDSTSRHPILLGTKYTLENTSLHDQFRDQHQIHITVPNDSCIAELHRVIYSELCDGIVSISSKTTILNALNTFMENREFDGVILGCTELTMMFSQKDFDVPVFDTTAIHAAAALKFSIEK